MLSKKILLLYILYIKNTILWRSGYWNGKAVGGDATTALYLYTKEFTQYLPIFLNKYIETKDVKDVIAKVSYNLSVKKNTVPKIKKN